MAIKMMLLLLVPQVIFSFQLGLDLNTFSREELNSLYGMNGLPGDFSWAITINSPGASDQDWRVGFINVESNKAISEDNPMNFYECNKIPQINQAPLLAAFGYHEVPQEGGTVLTWEEIDQYYNNCGQRPIVLLTRAYWPGPWRDAVQRVIRHPHVFGVAMEYSASEVGLRMEKEFVNDLLALNKHPMFLWVYGDGQFTSETQTHNLFQWFCDNNVNMYDDRAMVVVANYGRHISLRGNVNTIESAYTNARAWQGRFRQSHC